MPSDVRRMSAMGSETISERQKIPEQPYSEQRPIAEGTE